jgi:hypothetical protein
VKQQRVYVAQLNRSLTAKHKVFKERKRNDHTTTTSNIRFYDEYNTVKSLKNNNYRRSFNESDRDLSEMSNKSSILRCLPDFVPQTTDKSNIITEGMMSVLTHHLPMNYRLLPWHLLYCIERDGYSHHTFFDKVSGQCAYLLLIRDSLNHVFGAYLS